jgi:protein SCO1/2
MVGQMNTGRGRFAPLVAAVLALALIAGGWWWLARSRSRAADAPPLAGSGIGGPFTLIDQDGKRVSDRDFAGRYRLIYFGYTFCPDVCPTDLARNAKALVAAGDVAGNVQPIFITVDPERDTPAVLKQYVANFPPRLIGLTGNLDAVRRVAAEYKVFAEKQPTAGAAGYLMSHTDITYLMGPRGEPIAFFPGSDTPAVVATALRRYVR